MIPDLLAEFRRRLTVSAELVPDEVLQHLLDVASANIQPWLVDGWTVWQANVDEATVQLAVKLYDVSGRGVLDPYDGWQPGPSATPGMVRAVFGALGPALRAGGVSV